jgi:hypothetical protein
MADVYEPLFYKLDNIIGYTGEEWRDPTVYFCDQPQLFNDFKPWGEVVKGNALLLRPSSPVLANAKWGHITQKHDLPCNVGREEVKSGPHGMLNSLSEDTIDHKGFMKLALFEPRHQSRNVFIPRSVNRPDNPLFKKYVKPLTYELAVRKFQKIKPRYANINPTQDAICNDCDAKKHYDCPWAG